ncbi:hypothetical protein K503DRAFT_719455 [Rhizopogon vinicolor AM-OR11-026]|uniref:G-patch domain-containing protein n=1 Tax=Rhizopogon vinicolor AM-OR11-026 TaxID=1314800 RepID=A0A1B7MYG9_9AGAM|nr:hypothetical protein K503DRAFT_719455 [Rhizopogon vinicolor AM-OR11-026]
MSTARLKRKLGDLGIDTSSRKANENFCLIGTPLPPLEKSKDTGEFVPLWKQEVRDEKGRRRLHGAFTGGFSAGYFNSVGSKEGWTPSTFVSSRSDRAKSRAARPEDFMDEEDLTERRDDLKLVDEHEQMDLLGGTQSEMSRRGDGADIEKDAITLTLEQSLLPAPKDSAGARILKKMGWRIGQGIGPRITWRQREMAFGRDPDTASDDVDEEAKKHMYAPRDKPLIIVERKDNFHGLGYDPGLGLHASLGVAPEASKQPTGPRLAGACSRGFGLGALNDADDDDVDVYDHTQTHGRNRHAYDASDIRDEEHVSMSSRTRDARSLGKSAQPQRPSAVQITFRDGKSPLAGFVISDKPVAEDMSFPIPEVPQGWTPNPTRVWEKEKAGSNDKENEAILPSQPQAHAQWKAGISADQRGAALGETPLPSAPRSIFDYISKKDQDRIKNVTSSRFAPASASDTPSPGPSTPLPPTMTRTEPHVAQAALRGFQPFTTDPAKQARYTAYLQAHAEPGSVAVPLAQKPGQTPEDLAKEMSDYAKAAALFRPISGAMAGRFTSASVLDLGPKIIEGLHTPAAQPEETESSMDVDEEKPKEEVKEEDPKVHAARLGTYGVMTREVCLWQPARLLCKRFGVKDPNPEVPVDTTGPSTSTAAPEATGSAPVDEVGGASAATMQVEGGSSGSGKRDLGNIGLGEEDGQGDDVLTYERPGMDIFKAIFASDDEESDEEQDRIDGADDVDESPAISVPEKPSESVTEVKPAPPANGVVEDVDLATFKPTFIPRMSKTKDTEKKDKKSKKQKGSKGGTLVSFDVDEDGGESLSLTAARHKHRDRDNERPKKKKRKEREGDKGEDMWVEKPPPDIVKVLSVNLPPDEGGGLHVGEHENGPSRTRKRAIDFM